MSRLVSSAWILGMSLLFATSAVARKGAQGGKEGRKAMTLEEALSEADKALDLGAVGDAVDISARLHKSHGLKADELRRLDLIDARCGLVQGAYETSEKLLARLHKASPDDARISEWYARALDGVGKGESALPLLTALADKGGLSEGDSYWTLARLERKSGKSASALAHAKLALERPIVLQSDELDREIHAFIKELTPKGK